MCALTTACIAPSPVFDENFGSTLPVLRAQQTADLEAPVKNQARSVEGMDGRAARESLDRYYKSFREPPPQPNTLFIGVGGDDNR